jgi:hypothetical protein
MEEVERPTPAVVEGAAPVALPRGQGQKKKVWIFFFEGQKEKVWIRKDFQRYGLF